MNKPVQGAQSFSRSIAVLQRVADAGSPPTVAALARDLDLTRPTLYRILSALEAEGLVVQTSGKGFMLGARLIGLAHRALAQQDVRTLARAALTALRDETGETVHLAVRALDEMVYVDKVESPELVRMASTIGTRVPFHTTSVGKAFLSALPREEAEAVIDRLDLTSVTHRSLGDPSKLVEQVDRARTQGYTSDEEENETGIVCFGAAIRDATGHPVASVSVSVPTFRLNADMSVYYRPLVARCAGISQRLGYG